MAEALFAHALRDNTNIHVHSAGLGALLNHSADPISLALMQEKGIDISAHRARQLTPEIVYGSDLILTMSTSQTQQVESQYPGAKGRVHRVGKFSEYDISDPYRRPRAAFEQALILIEQGINDWYRKLWA